MKPFEERYTAWIDGKLSGDELLRFEEELGQQPGALDEGAEVRKMGAMLRDFGSMPPLTNPDFFNHQLLARIEAEQKPVRRGEGERTHAGWSFGRWAGLGVTASVVAIGLVLSGTLLRTQSDAPLIAAASAPYMVEIMGAEAPESGVWVTPLHSDTDDVTVLWIDGLDYLPASYELQ